MKSKYLKEWVLLGKNVKPVSKLNLKDVVDTLLYNRGLNNDKKRNEFFNPIDPIEIELKQVGLSKVSVDKAIKRLKVAKKNKEKIIIFGDYDADGVCATAILWETLYRLGFDVSPYIPDRFKEGYGLKSQSVINLKNNDPNIKVLLTVDNGIVANDAVRQCNKLGIDVIITDHHEPGEKYPEAYSVIHTKDVGGAAVSWFFAREISKELGDKESQGLDLAAIGTVSDQIPLLGANRSIVKYGLEKLNLNERLGLSLLYDEAGVKQGNINTYTIGFVIAPRINAMGRLEHAIDSLRLMCTNSSTRAKDLASQLAKVNSLRQSIVGEAIEHAKLEIRKKEIDKIIVIANKNYHEGVVGLVASRLVEEFYRPSVVFSKGNKYSKASARSVDGFNIIKAIRSLDNLLLEAGGHPMAAGVTILTKDLDKFKKEINNYAKDKLTKDLLVPRIAIDMEIDFSVLNWSLLNELTKFNPTGAQNLVPTFMTKSVKPWDIRRIGKDSKHLKLKLTNNSITIDSIGFGMGNQMDNINNNELVDIVYCFEENNFNGTKSMQIRLLGIRSQ